MPNTSDHPTITRAGATRFAQWIVTMTLVLGVVFLAVEGYHTGWAPLGPSETTTIKKDSKEQRTTAKGPETVEKHDVTTSSKESGFERALGSPGLWLLRALVIVIVAFFAGAAVQRVLLGEFSFKVGPVEVPPLPVSSPEPLAPVPESVVAPFRVDFAMTPSHIGITDPHMTLLENIQQPGPSDYAVIDLGEGRNWLTTRLFLVSILLKRMRGLRTLVFVETRDNIEQRFVGLGSPSLVRWRFAREYPWLEHAFAQAYGSLENHDISSDSGALALPMAAVLLERFINNPDIHSHEPRKEEGWDGSGAREHGSWVNRTLVDRVLDLAPVRCFVIDEGDLTGEARTVAVLSCEGPFVALTDGNRRFRHLVDRAAQIETVAHRVAANFSRAAVGQTSNAKRRLTP